MPLWGYFLLPWSSSWFLFTFILRTTRSRTEYTFQFCLFPCSCVAISLRFWFLFFFTRTSLRLCFLCQFLSTDIINHLCSFSRWAIKKCSYSSLLTTEWAACGISNKSWKHALNSFPFLIWVCSTARILFQRLPICKHGLHPFDGMLFVLRWNFRSFQKSAAFSIVLSRCEFNLLLMEMEKTYHLLAWR